MKNYTNEQVTLNKVGDVYYLEFNILKKYNDKLRHAITLRHGGVSILPVDSLNFRKGPLNSLENVISNINILCDKVGFDYPFYKAKQNHTDNILIITEKNKEKYSIENECSDEIDGIITQDKNIPTMITTADCNPIIIYDTKKNIVANIHSGWKGTIKRIYLKAVDILVNNFSSNIEDIVVCIGPSIRKCCFSSEEESFKEKFLNIWEDEKNYITYEENGRFHIDLVYLIKRDLLNIGIKKENIADANICTMCNYEDFFSYRIATKNKQEDFGCMATVVELI